MRKHIQVKQHDITDCGAACLASVSAYYKLNIPLSRIRQYANTDNKGTNVLGLLQAAERLNFMSKGAKGPYESLFKIPLPAIAHLFIKEMWYHYVVIYKVTRKHVIIMDPADGRLHKKKHTEFRKQWTGVIILLLPGEEFVASNMKQSGLVRFWELIKPHKWIMMQALFGALLYTILGLATSVYVQKIIDFVLVEGNMRLLNLLSTTMIALLIFQVIIGWMKSLFALRTGQHIDARLILGYYKHLLKLPQRFFDTMRTGEIISRVNDAVKIRVFINEIAINIIVNALIVVFSIGLMFLYYWKLAVIMLSIIPFYLIIYYASNRINKKWQRKLMEHAADVEAQLVESLNAAGTIKKFGIEDYTNHKTENRFFIFLKTIYKTGILSLLIGSFSEFITKLFTIILLWAGSYFVINHELSPGELLSFYALIGYFTGPALALTSANKNMQDALIASERLFEIIDLETEQSNEQKIELTNEMPGDIVFDNISFRYGSREIIFEGLSLTIKKNSATGIIGSSGNGKSTLISLLQNLYTVKDGSVKIGDIDIKYIATGSLRQLISVVPQHIDLFAGTITENIALGCYEPDMTRILELSRMLGLHEFIEKLPLGYNTFLDENGINLSGGQRQKIAIARALYRSPEILILDEATSSLDAESESKVQAALNWFKEQQKTVIIIAHKSAILKSCDILFEIKDKKAIEYINHV